MEQAYKKKLTFIYAFLILSILIISVSFGGLFKPDGEATAIWFQRSGSIAVVLALFAEVGVVSFSMKQYSLVEEMVVAKYSKWVEWADDLSKGIIMTGTIVWGYGDLIYNKLMG